MKLLIVDDSLVIRNKINRALLKKFTSIRRAENGFQALEFVMEDKPDVITMDLTMPKMGGVDSIQKIKSLSLEVHILVVSALADKATAIQALALGANGFICKPFSTEDLNAAVMKILEVKLAS